MKKILCAGAALLCAGAVQAVTEWPLDRLTVSAYYLAPAACTPERIRELREAGIDLLVHGRNGETTTLDLFASNGVTTVVNGVAPSLGRFQRAGDEMFARRPLEVYDRMAEKFVPHPAVTGIDMGDEPSALAFPYLSLVAERVSRLFPGRFPYLNLYPNYASVVENSDSTVLSQLGTSTYAEHVAEYLKWMPLNYLCFDFYIYSAQPQKRDWMMRRYYDNLETVAAGTRRTGRKMNVILLVGSSPRHADEWTSENRLRYQAFSSLAYGASMIGWACYGGGWWTNWVVNASGERTEQYAKLKKVNGELHALAPLYDRLRVTDTHFVGFEAVTNDWLGAYRAKNVAALDTGFFRGVRCETPAPLLVGEAVGRTKDDPWRALIVCAADDPYDFGPKDHVVRLTSAYPVRVAGPDGEIAVTRDEDGTIRFPLRSSSCAIVRTDFTAGSFSPNLDRSKFLIGVCRGLNEKFHDESYVKGLAAAGIDIACIPTRGNTPTEWLDLLHKYGIGAVVKSRGYWCGGDGKAAGQMGARRPEKLFADEAAAFAGAERHPARWMTEISDEPSALDMDYLGRMAALVNRTCPAVPAYINLYPNYAQVSWNSSADQTSQLGTKTYDEHIDVYCRTVPSDFICYDHYPFGGKPEKVLLRDAPKMYANFQCVADACRRTGRSFWLIPQVNSKPKWPERLTEDNFRFQASVALAYGCESLIWATWNHCWWTNSVVNADGSMSDHFGKLVRVNAGLHRLGKDYMRFRNVDTKLCHFPKDQAEALAKAGVATHGDFFNGYFRYLRADDGSALVVGDMVARKDGDRARAVLVVAAGDMCNQHPQSHRISFTAPGKIYGRTYDGPVRFSIDGNGVYSFSLKDGAAALVIQENEEGAPPFRVGACYLKSVSERHVADAKACGIDYFWDVPATDRKLLDLLHKYGIGAIATGVIPRWCGGNGSNAGKLDKAYPPERYREGVRRYRAELAHPAIWSLDICDEPNARDLPALGERCRLVQSLLPEVPVYCNLYPNYAQLADTANSTKLSQLGVTNYVDYIDAYVRHVPLDHISYDYYVYSTRPERRNVFYRKFFENFEDVAAAARRSGKRFVFIAQVNSRRADPPVPLTTNRLRYQAYSAMAFGAEDICWACYSPGWWTNNVLTAAGEKTEQYEKLRTMNRELHSIGPAFMRYRSVATHYVGFRRANGLEDLKAEFKPKLDACGVRGLASEAGSALLVGEMASRTGKGGKALFIVASGDPFDEKPAVSKVSFVPDAGVSVRAIGPEGDVPLVRQGAGLAVEIPENSAILLTCGD